MPKEVIFDKNRDQNEKYFVRLGWDKEAEYVRLATVNSDGGLMLPDTTKTKTELKPYDTETPGWFVSLDRTGINRLIRALRKARDDSFGRDE